MKFQLLLSNLAVYYTASSLWSTDYGPHSCQSLQVATLKHSGLDILNESSESISKQRSLAVRYPVVIKTPRASTENVFE